MSETLIATLITALVTLLVALITGAKLGPSVYKRIAIGCAVIFLGIVIFAVWQSRPVFSSQIVLEGERGTGKGKVMQRPNASEQRTIWLHAGEERTLQFELSTNAHYRLKVRYSNDNANGSPLEIVDLWIDGKSIGEFAPEDTGDGGYGWDIFKSDTVGSVELSSGPHVVTVLVAGGDGYGVEIDTITLEPIPTT